MAKTKLPENGHSFSITAPEARNVALVGDFTDWQEKPIQLKRNPNGTWNASVPLPPGTYHYRFLVDGQWRNDPTCPQRAPNPFGEENCVREIG